MSKLNFLFLSGCMIIFIWMTTLGAIANPSPDPFPIPEYEARYNIKWHGLQAGVSMHMLKRLPNGNFYFLTRTEPRFRVLPYHYVESSHFTWEDGVIKPSRYHYKIQEGKRNKNGNVEFNWADHKVSNSALKEPWSTDLVEKMQDKLTQTLSMRKALKEGSSTLTYTVAEEDKIRNYHFVILGEETLSTPLGALKAVKIQHTSRKGNKTTMWLAKNYDFLPVKMTQFRQGKMVASGDIISYKKKG